MVSLSSNSMKNYYATIYAFKTLPPFLLIYILSSNSTSPFLNIKLALAAKNDCFLGRISCQKENTTRRMRKESVSFAGFSKIG